MPFLEQLHGTTGDLQQSIGMSLAERAKLEARRRKVDGFARDFWNAHFQAARLAGKKDEFLNSPVRPPSLVQLEEAVARVAENLPKRG